ncbi:MAG: oxygen-independent coproporphyrinogen III oxidase [Granulosicoccaceae bacterium]
MSESMQASDNTVKLHATAGKSTVESDKASRIDGCDPTVLRHAKDLRAPRYTSYPTADQFVEAYGPDDYLRHLMSRTRARSGPLSVYVHIPFCKSQCNFCGCNKVVTQYPEKSLPYVWRLIDEMSLISEHLHGSRRLTQLHWGGGTPTFLSMREISALMNGVRSQFDVAESAEISIEIDPRSVDAEKIEMLAEQGFNRMSLGVQDFDDQVQHAINRVQSVELTRSVLDRARAVGFESTNFDLIYGLPLQTVESYARTVDAVLDMRPERIALYNYAHMPSRFPAQRLIKDEQLPSPEQKMEIFAMTNEKLDDAGYVYIGMDHFAIPDDELATAYKTGLLQRNFQGYSTQPENDLIALGASAISQIGASYSQNSRGVNDYIDRINQGVLATNRGFELSRDDLVRKAVIMALMCQGYVDKAAIELAHLIKFESYFKDELIALEAMVTTGDVELRDEAIVVTERGRRQTLRLIASQFDRFLQNKAERGNYSQVL